MRYGGLLWAALLGAGLTIQVGLNASVARGLKSPLLASLANFIIGLLALFAWAVVSRTPPPGRGALVSVPPWAWIAGFLGAFYVASTAALGPVLGAATLTALIIAGQLAAALLVDHYGLVGFPVHPLTLSRVAGAVLLAVGTVLIVRP